MKQVLIDVLPFEFKIKNLNESTSGGKLLVRGVLQRANAKNQNGRVYPKAILMREANVYNDNFVKQKRALGELDHAQNEIVNLKNVSHNIIDMNWEGDDLVGTIEVLTTPSGNILRELLNSGILLGISSRGVGSVKRDIREAADVVQDDYALVSFDCVSSPSTQGAFIQPIAPLSEGLIHNNKSINNQYENIEKIIHNILSEL